MPNRTATPKKTTTQRGYGNNHQRNRARLVNRHIDGRKCSWCGRPMFKDQTRNWDGKPLHAHHPEGEPTRTTATELMHDTCNKQCGKPGTREHLRPAAQTTPGATETERLVMPWP